MTSSSPSIQLSIDFQPLLTEQYKTLVEVCAAAVYASRAGLSGVAAHCDLSPSQLTRMLNPDADDPRNLPAWAVPKIVEATGDQRPILWLVAKFVPDEKTRQRLAVTKLVGLLPEIQNALAVLREEK